MSAPAILRTSLGTFGAKIAVHALGLATSVLIARTLGPQGKGAYAFLVTAAFFAFTLAHAGIEHANLHLFSSRQATLAALARHSALIAGVSGCAASGILAALFLRGGAFFSGVPLSHTLIVAASLPFSVHALYLAGLLVLDHRISATNQASLAAAGFQAAGTFACALADVLSVGTVLLLYTGSTAVHWACLAARTRSWRGPDPSPDPDLLKRMLAFGLKTQIGLILLSLLLRLDVLLLKSLAPIEEVGFYTLAVTLAGILWLATDAVAVAVLPHQAHRGADGAPVAAAAIRATLLAGGGLAILLLVAGPLAIRFLYGPAFMPSLVPFLLLVPGMLLFSFQRPCRAFLTQSGRSLTISLALAVQLGLNISLNLAWIGPWGATGAAAASTASCTAGTALFLAWFLRVSGLSWRDLLRFSPQETDLLRRILSARRGGGSSVHPDGPVQFPS